jgi:hypothetical protein
VKFLAMIVLQGDRLREGEAREDRTEGPGMQWRYYDQRSKGPAMSEDGEDNRQELKEAYATGD